MKVVYALIWRSAATDENFDQGEFERRIPRLMEWLRGLHADGNLVGCGGGGFENHAGGLTLITAGSIEEARAICGGHPMNEIGTNEILVWDVFFGDLVEKSNEERLRPAARASAE